MKTIIISLGITAISVTAQSNQSSLKYILTNNDTAMCKNIKLAFKNMECNLNLNDKGLVPDPEINLVYKNGNKVYKCEFFKTSNNQMNVLINFFNDDEWINSVFCDDIKEIYYYINKYDENDYWLSKN